MKRNDKYMQKILGEIMPEFKLFVPTKQYIGTLHDFPFVLILVCIC